jgi:hypothetical protein
MGDRCSLVPHDPMINATAEITMRAAINRLDLDNIG